MGANAIIAYTVYEKMHIIGNDLNSNHTRFINDKIRLRRKTIIKM